MHDEKQNIFIYRTFIVLVIARWCTKTFSTDKTCFKNPNISPKIPKYISTSHAEATSRKLKLLQI